MHEYVFKNNYNLDVALHFMDILSHVRHYDINPQGHLLYFDIQISKDYYQLIMSY